MKVLVAAIVLSAAPLAAGVVEVNLKLPLKPRLAISGDEKVAVAPFVISSGQEDGRNDRAARIDVQSEFARYLKKQITKSTKLDVVDAETPTLPSNDPKELEANRDFWRDIASKSGADFVLSGVIDFDIEDKAGYKTEEYVSPVDGRTYYRQVLVESTGFVFDIAINIYDGDTGEKLIEENFRDFKQFDQRNYDELLGLFENLRSLETQLLSIFVSQETAATRYVFTR
jgi:TolB-like protein